MMDFLFNNFQDILINFGYYLIEIISISFCSLGIVFLFGRFLNLIKYREIKNLIAAICIVSISVFVSITFNQINDIKILIWNIFTKSSISFVFYAIVCFRFFDRLDSFLDKFAKDKDKIDPSILDFHKGKRRSKPK